MINRLGTGEFTMSKRPGITDSWNPYEVDGVRLQYALYCSDRYGCRLFWPGGVERASKPQSYVEKHPNRPLLDQTFKEMATLSENHGFEVTVVIAPSAPRLYAPYFADVPKISDEPYFINYVAEISRELGFDVINLLPLMQPFAAKELLYWRDDPHWNGRGNEVVAEIIASHILSQRIDLSN